MENIITDEQRTEEWFQARLGRLTASRFGDLLTMPRSKKDREAGVVSQTTKSYLLEKITEVLTGESRELSSEALDWGTQMEQEAREFYELKNITEVKQTGFVVHKDIPMIGGSPDGLVDEDGLVEFKCPYNGTNFTEYLFDGPIPKSYFAQVQGDIWILDKKWCDFAVYNPKVKNEDLRMFVVRIARDDEYIKTLETAVNIALKNYEQMLKKVGLSFEDILNDKLQTQDQSN